MVASGKMSKKTGIYLLVVLCFGLFILSNVAYTQTPKKEPMATPKKEPTPTPTVQAATEPAAPDLKKIEEQIKSKQEKNAKELEAAQKSLEITTPTPPAEVLSLLNKQVEWLQKIDITYNQQITALQQSISIDSKIKQYSEELNKLKSTPPTNKTSFIDLDNLRDEWNNENRRKESVELRVKAAQEAWDQSRKSADEKKDQYQNLQEDILSGLYIDGSVTSTLQMKVAQAELRAASEMLRLREMELKNADNSRKAYQSQMDLLNQRIRFIEVRAAFTQNDLEEQIKKLDKEDYDLNRDLKKTNDDKATAEKRLNAAREKAAQAPEPVKNLQDEVDTRQLEWDGLQTRIENINKSLAWSAKRKTVWQQRYAVYNGEGDNQQYEKWKQETKTFLDELDRDDTILKLRLNERQSDLVTRAGKMESAKNESAQTVRLLETQQKFMLQIVKNLQDQQNNLETTRHLHKKLIDEINVKTARLSWSERYEILMHKEYHGNPISSWLYALAILLCAFVVLFLIRWLLVNRLRQFAEGSKTEYISVFTESIKRTKPLFFLFLSIFFASQCLTISNKSRSFVNDITAIALVIQGAIWISYLFRSWIFRYLAKKSKRDSTSLGALSIFNFISQLVIWSLALILALSNLGIDVTALVTGLGIGGVAVALALQRILGDLFASLSIVLDKPFVIGDFIVFDQNQYMGTVEYIGIKSTRIRSLAGEQIICSNSNLLDTRIRNFKRMQERRVVFTVGVVYQTPLEKLNAIQGILRDIVVMQPKTRFDRAHFKNYGDSALVFEVVYYVSDSDYNIYMNIQHTINIEIFRRFQEMGIKFAFPTQTLYIQKSSIDISES